MIKKLLYIIFFVISGIISYSQPSLCDSVTPTFNVNLSSSPTATFISNPAVRRLGNCCSTTSPDRCVQFIITLHPGAAAIRFDIASGAIPPGAMFYQIGCGPQTQVGNAICLSGAGPHILTFCKPGNNLNTYQVTSIPAPFTSSPDTVVQGCYTPIQINGVVVDSTIAWTSIFPGAPGAYNNLLDCTIGCKTVNFTPDASTPPYVDYLVCGTPEAPCMANAQFCDTVRVNVLPQLEVTAPSQVVYCSLDGGVQLNGTAFGGSPPYTLSWTNSSGTQIGNTNSVYVTAPGTYTFSASDNTYSTCPIVKSTTITVIQKLPAVVDAGSDLSICPDNPTATLNGSIVNGTTVQWTGGAGTFTPNRTTLNPTYTMTPTEIANGGVTLTLNSTGDTICPPNSSTVDLIITPPLAASINAQPIICYGTRASLSVTITGGTPPYSVLWNSGETTQSISQKLPGTYIVTITDNSASACVISDTFQITQDPPVTVTIPPSVIKCDTIVTIRANVTSGRAPFSYQWNTFQTVDSIQAYTGKYYVTVTDSLGCKGSDTTTVTATNSILAATVSPPPAVCVGNSAYINVDVTGNIGSYTSLWSNGSTTDSIYVPAGSYCVTVTDSLGCITTACGDLVEDTIKFDITPVNVTCFGGSNGAALSIVTSGYPPYNYRWSGNGNTDTTSSSSNLTAGSYLLTVTDDLGCQLAKPITINEPPQIVISTSKTNVTCNGFCNGSASATVTGGVPPYTYFWPLASSSSDSVFSLCAQTYSLIVTDSNGCSSLSSVNITQPARIGASFNIIDANCGKPDGNISVNASGGTPGYTYSWTPGNQTSPVITGLSSGISYCVKITDNNGCIESFCASVNDIPGVNTNITGSQAITCIGRCDGSINSFSSGGLPPYNYLWSNSYSTQNISSLCTGVYTLLTIDANGCQDTSTAYVGYPPPVTVSANVPANVCDSGGTATAFGSGGNGGPFTFLWNPGAQNSSSISVYPANSPYSVRAYDVNGCESDSAIVNVVGYFPITSSLSLSPSDSVCLGESLMFSATASGGNPGYQYNWTPSGAVGQSVTIYPNNTGYEYVTISDACGTQKRDSVLVTVLPLPYLDPQSDVYFGCAPLCVNLSNANATYPSCSWDFGDGNTEDSCFVNHCYNVGGQYYPVLTVTDQFGCVNSDSTSFYIDVISQPVAQISVSHHPKDIYVHRKITFTDVSPYTGTNQWYFTLNGDTIFEFGNTQSPVITFQESGEYLIQLINTNSDGCSDTVYRTVIVKDLEYIYVPNTFTPNGNGDNEKFKPSIIGSYDYETYKFMIFNRWGQLIYNSNLYGEAWDGTYKGVMSKEDTYVWKLSIRLLYEDRQVDYIGHVNLLK